ncbi:hypothetical protein OHB30_48040 [Streptomyces europaeiscabiei]|nr:hypothetical protein OHB30_48040 [Streptomyces europaeiscabiei]
MATWANLRTSGRLAPGHLRRGGLPGAGVDLLGGGVEYDPEGGGRLRADPLDFGRVFTLAFAVSRSARAGSLVATSTSSRSKASWTALVVKYTEVDSSAARRRESS